jgi:hypothetical protein
MLKVLLMATRSMRNSVNPSASRIARSSTLEKTLSPTPLLGVPKILVLNSSPNRKVKRNHGLKDTNKEKR